MQSSSRIITTNKPTSSFLTGWMPFLSPNQQCQSTEGKSQYYTSVNLYFLPRHQRCSFGRMSNLLETERWLLSVVISQMICMYFTQTIVTVVSSNIFWWHNIQNSLTLQCVLNAAARVHIHRERTVPLQSTVIMKNNWKVRKKQKHTCLTARLTLVNWHQKRATRIKPTAPLSPLWSLQFTHYQAHSIAITVVVAPIHYQAHSTAITIVVTPIHSGPFSPSTHSVLRANHSHLWPQQRETGNWQKWTVTEWKTEKLRNLHSFINH